METENTLKTVDTLDTADNAEAADVSDAAESQSKVTEAVTDVANDRESEIMGEISAIKASISGMHRGERVASELRELLSVIPNADLSVLDDEAFDAIARGEGLVYSYLLSERRRAKIAEANKANLLSSAGDIGGSVDTLYTIDEIRSMDRKTVRKNFDKIMKSLERVK